MSCEYAYEKPSFNLKDYGLEDEIFGVISIPELELEMPIYLGATYQHLADGAAHLSQTSIPVGGENTNSVIAGHRGWGGASYFRYITNLEVGDEVIITNLWDTTIYEVKCVCGNVIAFDEETLEEGSIICDECGETLEFSFEDDDEDEE